MIMLWNGHKLKRKLIVHHTRAITNTAPNSSVISTQKQKREHRSNSAAHNSGNINPSPRTPRRRPPAIWNSKTTLAYTLWGSAKQRPCHPRRSHLMQTDIVRLQNERMYLVCVCLYIPAHPGFRNLNEGSVYVADPGNNSQVGHFPLFALWLLIFGWKAVRRGSSCWWGS